MNNQTDYPPLKTPRKRFVSGISLLCWFSITLLFVLFAYSSYKVLTEMEQVRIGHIVGSIGPAVLLLILVVLIARNKH